MIFDCLSEFDFSNGLEGLYQQICYKILEVADTPEGIRDYVDNNKKYTSNYPDVIASMIWKAFKLLQSLDKEKIDAIKRSENDEGQGNVAIKSLSEKLSGASTGTLKIVVPSDNPEITIINSCLDDIAADDVDVLELSYEMLEVLINKHKSKAEILSKRPNYEAIIELFQQPVIEAFNDAMHKIDILSDGQVEEIRKIIES